MMQSSHVEVVGVGLDVSHALRWYAQHRVWIAVQRFARRIGRVTVRLQDINGRRRGVDQVCRIYVDLGRWGTVVVGHVHEDAYAAVDHATTRVKYAIAQRLAVRQSRRRMDRPVRQQAVLAEVS